MDRCKWWMLTKGDCVNPSMTLTSQPLMDCKFWGLSVMYCLIVMCVCVCVKWYEDYCYFFILLLSVFYRKILIHCD